jgi:hypothetical protein
MTCNLNNLLLNYQVIRLIIDGARSAKAQQNSAKMTCCAHKYIKKFGSSGELREYESDSKYLQFEPKHAFLLCILQEISNMFLGRVTRRVVAVLIQGLRLFLPRNHSRHAPRLRPALTEEQNA